MDLLLIAVWGAVGVLTVGFAWSLWSDRSRGRLRCPTCWYTIDLPTRTECSECGRAIANERQLNRTRRHPWRSGAFAFGLLVSVYITTCIELIRQEGWVGTVPTIALVGVTDGDAFWKEIAGQPISRTEQLTTDRIGVRRASLLSRRLWAHRVAGAYGGYPYSRIADGRARVHSVEGLDLVWVGDMFDGFIGEARRYVDREAAYKVLDMLTASCDPWAWVRHGGDQALIGLVADHILVVADDELNAEVAVVLDAIRPGRTRAQAIALQPSRPRPVVRYALGSLCPPGMSIDEVEHMLGDLSVELEETVRPTDWSFDWDLANAARLWIIQDDFVIAATPDHHKEIAAFIDAKAATIKASD